MINNYLERQIKENFPYQPTPEQEIAVKSLSEFLLSPRSEVVFMLRGYAGTGKTSLVGALVRTLDKLQQKSVLLAPTGRAAKVFSAYAGHPAFTIHKKIYRQPTSTSPAGDSSRPWPTISCSSAASCAMPPPAPPSVNEGRSTTG